MINVSVGWLLYERTADPWSLGLVGVAELTPVLLLMVVAGNAADRYPRRNIGIFAHAVLALAASGLTLLSWLDGPTWAIYSLLFLIGTAVKVALAFLIIALFLLAAFVFCASGTHVHLCTCAPVHL